MFLKRLVGCRGSYSSTVPMIYFGVSMREAPFMPFVHMTELFSVGSRMYEVWQTSLCLEIIDCRLVNCLDKLALVLVK